MDASVTMRACGQAGSRGERIEAWTLCGSGGLVVEVINYGAAVTRVSVPDRDGQADDVVLGFNDPVSYLQGTAYFGAVVGRVAGRVTGARFELEGTTYSLAANDGPNHLHGGLKGFDKKIWKAEPRYSCHGEPALRLTYQSPHLEEGYPGTVDVTVNYTVTHQNVLRAETCALADRPTPFSLTFHHYFNLAGESSGSLAGHDLQIHADEFIPTDGRMTLLGHARPVDGAGCDFRIARNLGEAIPGLFQNHGDLYVLRGRTPEDDTALPPCAARLVDRVSGRTLTIFTTASHLQLYTAANLNEALMGKSGTPYARYAGVCLECEGYPDGANVPEMGDIVLHPGVPRKDRTFYAFGIEH